MLALLIAAVSVLAGFAGYALSRQVQISRRLAAAEEERAARVAELATLHTLARGVVTTSDPDRLFAIVERECRKILPASEVLLGLVDRETDEVRTTERAPGDLVPRRASRPLGDPLVAQLLRERRPLALEGAEGGAVRSTAAAPLLVGDRVVGLLALSAAGPRAYDDHHLALLAIIAQHAALAVHSVRHESRRNADALTDLCVREVFLRRLEHEHARAKRYGGAFSVLMLDLDGFREINDRHGFHAGDRYLRGVGATLAAQLRGADLGCRYGGDEFAVLLPETAAPGAGRIAERMRAAIGALVVTVDGSAVRGTVSIGFAAYPEHEAGEPRLLVLRADHALYQAKRAGRDRVVPFCASA